MAKIIEHEDMLGQPLKVGSYVVASVRNTVYVSQVMKMTAVMIRVVPIAKSGWYDSDGHLVYPSQVVVLSGPDVLAYILKNSGPKDA